MTTQQEKARPPQRHVSRAVEMSTFSPCRSKRGVSIFRGETPIASGYNFKPRGFDCDGSEACKATCRSDAVHAEQFALLRAGSWADGCDMLHVKTVGGALVASGGPSCVQCSKLALASGIAGVWLYHETGWKRYEMAEFHAASLLAEAHLRTRLSETQAAMEREKDAHQRLKEELSQLRAWKESALEQLVKSEALHEVLRGHVQYLGWDVHDAATDRIRTLEASLERAQQERDEWMGIAKGLDDAVAGRVRSLAEIEAQMMACSSLLSLTEAIRQAIPLLRLVRVLDCGAHYCRYCPAKSPEWEHSPSCPYVESQRDYSEARALADRLEQLLPEEQAPEASARKG